MSATFAEAIANEMLDVIEGTITDTYAVAAASFGYSQVPSSTYRATQSADRLIEQSQRTRGRVNQVLNLYAAGRYGDPTSQATRQEVRDRIESQISADWRIRRTARTETAIVTNLAATDSFSINGEVAVLLSDGPDCHLGPGHKVGPLANGLRLTLAEAQARPVSHPNCVRRIAPG